MLKIKITKTRDLKVLKIFKISRKKKKNRDKPSSNKSSSLLSEMIPYFDRKPICSIPMLLKKSQE